MSELSTRATQDLLTRDLKQVFAGNESARWEAYEDLMRKTNGLVKGDLVDDEAARELAISNAEDYGLNHEAADTVMDVRLRSSGGSLSEMRMQPSVAFRGTGTAITTAGPDVVHYINRPGPVEEWYGPGLPYVVEKLAWMAIASSRGHRQLDNRGGYQYVTDQLRSRGLVAASKVLHIGPWNNPELGIISSPSGILVKSWVEAEFDKVPQFGQRAILDEAAGRFDGRIENKRAGLNDAIWGELAIKALRNEGIDETRLQIPHPDLYSGKRGEVDIN